MSSDGENGGNTMRDKENLTLLGSKSTAYKTDYDPSVLECFTNKHPDNDYFVKFKGQQSVPDPYYGGDEDFELALDLIEDGCDGLLAALFEIE